MINIVLSPFDLEIALYPNQLVIQQGLAILAFGSIPVMLLAKPILLYLKHGKKAPAVEHQVDFEEEHAVESSHGGGHGHGHGEVFLFVFCT